ncbi:hypothetical protein Micbo1qcDRAFT_221021 [Microdochium bolleyi]|uniref:Uncharacterized protein n=1 Tax=Microdochium bolleyi TaxID=196109 RepID=A0A136JBD5_9PEZI|nr:hypothetical protein Micbo1qcDRAFT_221021 [Microdochium bolleyi]
MARKKADQKPILQNCVIALAGDLGKPDWTDEQIDKWVSMRRGKYVRSLDSVLGTSSDDDDITHVLATEELFRRMTTKRKKMLKDKGVHVVLWDWLEDSIVANRRLPEAKFDLLRRHREELSKAEAKQKKLEKIARGVEEAKKGVNTNLNHVYMDETCFSYDIVITRMDPETKMVGEKWRLRLWESNGSPHLYRCTATFNKRGGKTIITRPSNMETPGPLARELGAFKRFFRIKTRIAWKDRVSKAGENKERVENFQYEPPIGGKPLGVFNDEPDDSDNENSEAGLRSRKRKLRLEDAGKEDYDEVQRRRARIKKEQEQEIGVAKHTGDTSSRLNPELMSALSRLQSRPQCVVSGAEPVLSDGEEGEEGPGREAGTGEGEGNDAVIENGVEEALCDQRELGDERVSYLNDDGEMPEDSSHDHDEVIENDLEANPNDDKAVAMPGAGNNDEVSDDNDNDNDNEGRDRAPPEPEEPDTPEEKELETVVPVELSLTARGSHTDLSEA